MHWAWQTSTDIYLTVGCFCDKHSIQWDKPQWYENPELIFPKHFCICFVSADFSHLPNIFFRMVAKLSNILYFNSWNCVPGVDFFFGHLGKLNVGTGKIKFIPSVHSCFPNSISYEFNFWSLYISNIPCYFPYLPVSLVCIDTFFVVGICTMLQFPKAFSTKQHWHNKCTMKTKRYGIHVNMHGLAYHLFLRGCEHCCLI